VLLFRKRAMLDPGQLKFTRELGSEEAGLAKALEERERLELGDPGLKSLAFLYDAYEPQRWWFEVFETGRRLLLTGGLLFLSPGTAGQVRARERQGVRGSPPRLPPQHAAPTNSLSPSHARTQIAASMVMCLGAMRIYAGYKPFVDHGNSLLAECAQWQLFFTMFAALLIRVDVDKESVQDKAMFDAVLVGVQFAAVVVLVTQYLFCKTDKEAVEDAVKHARASYTKADQGAEGERVDFELVKRDTEGLEL
jgi:hypothetical protein